MIDFPADCRSVMVSPRVVMILSGLMPLLVVKSVTVVMLVMTTAVMVLVMVFSTRFLEVFITMIVCFS